MPEEYDEERERLTRIAFANPRPCLVCGDKNIVGVATWIPDEKTRLAAGGTKDTNPVFAFCLCEEHAEDTEANQKALIQQILREVRTGRGYRV